jgi:N-sulfoglucosamine sulfohydrolase
MGFIFKLILLFLIIISCQGCKEQQSKHDNSMNIILVVSDDHGADALGCYGNHVIKTPFLDQFSSEGVLFTNAFCTAATCSASRSTILTGRYGHATGHYGHSHGYHHFSTYDTVTSLPLYLEQAGYHTARIGKYHLAPESVYNFMQVLEADPRNTVEMAEKCRIVIEGDHPFFLYFCMDDPHRGDPFIPESWELPNNFGNREDGFKGVEKMVYDPADVIVPHFLPDTRETRLELAQYYQSVSRIDQGFGRLMQILDETGKAGNTLVIYISDNGIAFPGAKTTTYDPGIKLPCIIRDPASERSGIVNDIMISWVDLTPTILDYAGIDEEKLHFHGRSFRSVIDQTDAKGWDEVYCSHIFHEVTMYYPMRVLRDRKYKLIWNIAWRSEYPFASDLWASSTWQGVYRRGDEYFGSRRVDEYMFRPEFELYNIVEDPHELKNLAFEQSHELVLEAMKNKIKNFQRNTQDPWILFWEHDDIFGGTGVNL